MLADSKVMAMVAVSDLSKGKEFYSGTLGLKEVGENPGGVMYECGGSTLFLYPSPGSAGHNQATSASWVVDDIETEVAVLKEKGITFEYYDIPNATIENDIYTVMPGMKAAWFKDPDGNILGLASDKS